MYDPTFGPTALDRRLRPHDFKDLPALKNATTRQAKVRQAVQLAKNGLSGIVLHQNDLAGRTIYRVSDLPAELVLRKATQNLRKISRAKQSNRLDIIRRLRLLCEEGLPFCVAKFDIKQFYPSIDQDELTAMLSRRLSTSPGTRTVLNGLVAACKSQGVQGVPPGLAISAALGEMYMQDFDKAVQRELQSHLFARYVDDIVIVLPPTSNLSSLRKKVASLLPTGLVLNEKKTKLLQFASPPQKSPIIENKFDYLGFAFSVEQIAKQRPQQRKVSLDISEGKIKLRKTRIVRSFQQYLSDGNFDDLRARLRIISSSYKFYDNKKSRMRTSGIYHTYGLIDLPSPALLEMDAFLKKIVLSNSGKICGPLSLSLTNAQKSALLSLSFVEAFQNKTHFHYSPDRLKHLMECWKYG